MSTDRARLGPYRVLRRIGAGGMAEVFLAEVVKGPLPVGTRVAIKRLLPEHAADTEMLDRFLGEADLARMIRHPGLVQMLDAGTYGETPYLVMEYVDGRDLAQVLDRCRQRGIPLPVAFSTHIVGRVLEALVVVHDARSADGSPLGVVHCDVNPSNVFISRLGEIKLGDFGVALVAATEARQPGAVMGKLSYLAPEQVRGEEIVPATDLYALGVVLYEMLTTEKPYEAPDVDSLLRVFAAPSVWAPSVLRSDVPAGIDAVSARALAVSLDERFPDATTFLASLEPFRDERVGNDLAIASVVRGLFPEES